MPKKGRTSSAKCIFKKEKDSSNQRGSHIFGQIIFLWQNFLDFTAAEDI